MPKYLIKASYTSEGARGLLKEGGIRTASRSAEAHRRYRRQSGGLLFRVR